jgi:hypothetical protein
LTDYVGLDYHVVRGSAGRSFGLLWLGHYHDFRQFGWFQFANSNHAQIFWFFIFKYFVFGDWNQAIIAIHRNPDQLVTTDNFGDTPIGAYESLRKHPPIEVIFDMYMTEALLMAPRWHRNAEGGVTEESVRDTLVDKHIIALSEDVVRLYCETSAADIALPVHSMTLVKNGQSRLAEWLRSP